MRKSRLLLPLVILVLLGTTQLFAANGKGFKVGFDQGSKSSSLNYNLDDYKLTTLNIDGKNYTQIIFDGKVTTEQKGFAQLPFISASVQIADRGDVDVQVVSGQYIDHQLEYPLLPSRGVIYRNQDPANIPYTIAADSLVNKWYPENIVKSSKPYILRDVRGTNVYVHPFRYNALKNTLRVYTSIEVALTSSKVKSTNAMVPGKRSITPTMHNIYNSMFINYGSNSKDDQLNVGNMGDMLVLYTARDQEVIQSYIEWKKQKGFNVEQQEVAVGTNVKDIINQAYQDNNNLLYVQLVGDWPDIKSDLGPDRAPTDPMLGCVHGDDYYADVIVGRFSGNSAEEISVQVQKAINYEKNPEINGSWYKNAIGIASAEGGPSNGDDGESDQLHMETIRNNRLLPTTYSLVHEEYDNNNTNANRVKNDIEGGVGLINYVGHGSATAWSTSRFSNSNIKKLTNQHMLPFIISVACINGEFHKSGDAFAEVWLKKEGGGAVAAWMATINQPWAPPMRGQDYFNDLLIGGYDYDSNPGSGTNISGHRTTFGSLTLNAAHLMYAEADGSSDRKTIQTWTIFGDASLQVRTDSPSALALSNQAVKMGIPFSTTVTSDGAAVEGAIVSLYQDGISYSAISDQQGKVTVDHQMTAGEATLTITAFNTQTIHQPTKVIPPAGPHLALEEVEVVDCNNHEVDYGETVNLSIVLNNLGTEISEDISLTLSTDSEYVASIDDSTEAVDKIPEGGTLKVHEAFEVSFIELIADQTIVPFKLVMTDSSNKKIYETSFMLTVNAPVFEVSPSTTGLKPGEVGEVKFILSNTGHAPASNLSLRLSEKMGIALDIINPEQSIDDLVPGFPVDVAFTVNYGANIPLGATANFMLEIMADLSQSASFNYLVTIGITESFESGAFAHPNWSHSGDLVWGVDEEVTFGGDFAGKSGTITHNQSSVAELEIEYFNAGTLSFHRKVSSEVKYDKLIFYIDGIEQKSWSGDREWKEFSFNIEPGVHTFKWAYIKDPTLSRGADCAWIDNVLAAQ